MGDPRLTLTQWDALRTSEREDLARSVELAHPRFRFLEIRHHEMGDQARNVALFACEGSEFALIPGSEATLGYDRGRPWVPDERERRDYEEECACFRRGHELNLANLGSWYADRYPPPAFPPLQDLLSERLTPLRRATIEPFLMDVRARQTSIRFLDEGDPDVDPTVREKLTPGLGSLSRQAGVRRLIYHLDRSGRLIVEEKRPLVHSEVSAELEAEGFRLPTSDEWEYACGAGSRTLFRWGDHVPAHAFEPPPSFLEEDEDAWNDPMTGPELSRGFQIEGPEQGCPSDEPNAFGLFYEQQSRFHQEFVAEPDILRHGDGGTSFCAGGGGLFTSLWLGQATAFVWKVPEEMRGHGRSDVDVRRAYSLRTF